MKKIILFCSVVLLIFILFRPDKIVRSFFRSKISHTVPSKYINEVPNQYLNGHIYSIVYSNNSPISFFRTEKNDFITTEIKTSNSFKINNTSFKKVSSINQFGEIFDFKSSRIVYLNNFKNEEINNFAIEGSSVKSKIINNFLIVYESSSNFKILLNEKVFFFIETRNPIYVILKRKNLKQQLFIVEQTEVYNFDDLKIFY